MNFLLVFRQVLEAISLIINKIPSSGTMWSPLSLGPTALLSLSSIISIVYSQDEMIYKNSSYSALERATDLLQRMTWAEKIGQMGGVRVLLGTNLAFNETTYDSTHELQNGILGNSFVSLMLRYIQQKKMLNHIYLRFRI